MPIKLKLVSSMEKCFLDESIEDKTEISELSMLKNERLSFQLIYTSDERACIPKGFGKLSVISPISEHISLSEIRSVPVHMPAYPHRRDEHYLRTAPGLYPDLLMPTTADAPVRIATGQLYSILVSIECEDGISAGEYPVEFSLTFGEASASASISINVIDAMLPKQTLIHTQWFHNDCLATYYNCEMFSDRHFEIIENYMQSAHRFGINMILVPVLTPPLDTEIGGERPTAQLVDVTVRDGKYEFSYEKLDRYLDIAIGCGMEYFEISHLFTQWGAAHAPKVMATVIDGTNREYKRIFGWETDSAGEEYTCFLRAFVSALLEHLRARGIDKKCSFHISDEPTLEHFERYVTVKESIADLLEGYKIMDALSNYEFYKTGACSCPIPSNDRITPFIESEIPELWTYYCCAQTVDVSNRFTAMPGERMRILGVQLFKYNIAGFLHWGFNFWYNDGSKNQIDPFADTCGDMSFPGGDAFSVYPGADGKPLLSLRSVYLYEAFQDMRALELLAQLKGREAAAALIDDGCDEPLTFSVYPHSSEYILSLRDKVNRMIKANI